MAGAVALALAGCALWAQAGGAGRSGSGPLAAPGTVPTRTASARTWLVQPGDTVWAIARTVQGAGDIRPLVDKLSREAGGRPLQVGRRLALP